MTTEQLEAELEAVAPKQSIHIRRVMAGGFSGAQVLLVEFTLMDERRFGVLKIGRQRAIEREAEGYAKARETWLRDYLPDHVEALGQLPSAYFALLSSLAKGRVEDCRTLEEALRESFPYGVGTVLRALSFAYRQQAAAIWSEAKTISALAVFREPLEGVFSKDWLKRWVSEGLPKADHPGLVLQDRTTRLPNPVALLENAEAFGSSTEITIPYLPSHGDLNARNVLCPSVGRAVSQGIHGDTVKILEHLSLIDFPAFRELPFPWDLGYLLSCLTVLLPEGETRAAQDTRVAAFEAVVAHCKTGSATRVPNDAHAFVECAKEIWLQASYAQPAMQDDLREAFLLSVSSAALQRAVRFIDRPAAPDRNRSAAVSSLAFSAICLSGVLGEDRIPGPDSRVGFRKGEEGAWTPASAAIAEIIAEHETSESLVLVLGRRWAKEFDLPQDSELADADLETLRGHLKRPIGPDSTDGLRSIGALPLQAVVDWAVLPQLRSAIAEGLDPARHEVRLTPGAKAPDWRDRSCLFYFHLRGSYEDVSTVATTPPQRTRARGRLRQLLKGLAKRRAKAPTIFYVGVEGELSEIHNFLAEVWAGSLSAVYVGTPAPSQREFLEEWEIRTIDGTTDDFLRACGDHAAGHPQEQPRATAAKRTLSIAGMDKGPDGTLVSAPDKILALEVPSDDLVAIERAGTLLLQRDRVAPESGRAAREFYIGHRAELADVANRYLFERDAFPDYLSAVASHLERRGVRTLAIPSSPGAGGSAAILWLAYRAAFELHIPTFVLEAGGTSGFESIERIQALVGRSFLVVADPEDVPADEVQALASLSAPRRYSVVFLTTRRVARPALGDSRDDASDLPLLTTELSDPERLNYIALLGKHCVGVEVGSLNRKNLRSMFLLSLEAFGGDRIGVKRFLRNVLEGATVEERFLLAVVAVFSRYAHRPCGSDFLEALEFPALSASPDDLLARFDQLVVLHSDGGWTCRHEELTRGLIEFQLTATVLADGEDWRYRLPDLICRILELCDGEGPAGDIMGDFVWATLNPRLEGDRSSLLRSSSRLLDEIPETVMRRRVFQTAVERFPNHVHILSHFGKFLSEEEKKYEEAEIYLRRALDLELEGHIVKHMLGKRFSDEVRELIRRFPVKTRSPEEEDRISQLAQSAHHWFDQAREADFGSEYAYTTPMQLDMILIEDEFRRHGVASVEERPEALLEERISELLAHAEALAADGLRYVSPNSRRMFSQVRDKLHYVRGDLDTAIECFRKHVSRAQGKGRTSARIQLARLYLDRASAKWLSGSKKAALRDFEEGERALSKVLEDPQHRYSNIKLWFSCARYISHWTRGQFLEKLHQLHGHAPSLDSAFLLMCIYFIDAVDTTSLASWRKMEEHMAQSARLSANLAVRPLVREWLIRVRGDLQICPSHLLATDDPESKTESRDLAEFEGMVTEVRSSTAATLKLEPSGFELFFRPRVRQGESFYKSDENRTRVKLNIGFTYEKPLAYQVRRIRSPG